MKARIVFDLSDPDEIKAHWRCCKATDMVLALWSINQQVQRICDESENGRYIDAVLVERAISMALSDHSINLDELID